MAEYAALPLFTDAYLADTRHLTTEEHGAYLLLLFEAWRRPNCDIPDDDVMLAKLAGLPKKRWMQIRSTVLAFWKRDGRRRSYVQKRLLAERVYVAAKSKSQSDKAASRWHGRKKKDAAALPQESRGSAPTPTPTPTPIEEGTASAAPSSGCAAPDFRDVLIKAFGEGSTPRMTAAEMVMAKRWVDPPPDGLGLSEAEVADVIRSGLARSDECGMSRPASLRYFNGPMADFAAAKARPPPDVPTLPARPAQFVPNFDLDRIEKEARR